MRGVLNWIRTVVFLQKGAGVKNPKLIKFLSGKNMEQCVKDFSTEFISIDNERISDYAIRTLNMDCGNYIMPKPLYWQFNQSLLVDEEVQKDLVGLVKSSTENIENFQDWMGFKISFKEYARSLSQRKKQSERKEIAALERIIWAIDKSDKQTAESCISTLQQSLPDKQNKRTEARIYKVAHQYYLNERNFNLVFKDIKKEEKMKNSKQPKEATYQNFENF